MSSETRDGEDAVDRPNADYGPSARTRTALDADQLRTYLLYGALGLCVLLALVATVNFYGSASHAIDVWVSERYQPLYQAAFNLGVLLLAAVGISLVVRRL
ncbi:hypothetical protein ACFPYI_03645 [Halomarina salina]|uniref:DUF8060 domain-containing protein n=1 Tax=Halomarina salina TaxID=1872699 RepID=A0ABD5RIW8_9EURY|nr:hypothetical protein [Halomarina salina]